MYTSPSLGRKTRLQVSVILYFIPLQSRYYSGEMSTYFTLLFCGLFFIGLEIFVPGGVLGILGGAALVGAAVIGFKIFPIWGGWVSLLSILILTGAALYAWVKYLPQSPIGKALSLHRKIQKDPQDQNTLWQPGMTGITLCELRPSGKAMIDDRRADVIADTGAWINHEVAIEVVRVEGNRIYVKETDAGS